MCLCVFARVFVRVFEKCKTKTSLNIVIDEMFFSILKHSFQKLPQFYEMLSKKG